MKRHFVKDKATLAVYVHVNNNDTSFVNRSQQTRKLVDAYSNKLTDITGDTSVNTVLTEFGPEEQGQLTVPIRTLLWSKKKNS